jgi:hypothetical protein
MTLAPPRALALHRLKAFIVVRLVSLVARTGIDFVTLQRLYRRVLREDESAPVDASFTGNQHEKRQEEVYKTVASASASATDKEGSATARKKKKGAASASAAADAKADDDAAGSRGKRGRQSSVFTGGV